MRAIARARIGVQSRLLDQVSMHPQEISRPKYISKIENRRMLFIFTEFCTDKFLRPIFDYFPK